MLLEMREITKTYGPVVANDRVSLGLQQGEILAIVGENGAGKSTIMKILYGLERADSGEIWLRGERVDIRSPLDAMARGIGMVQQHFMLFESLTVAENIVFRKEKSRSGFLDAAANRRLVKELSSLYGLEVDPDAVVGELPVGTQQRVEILKILYQDAEIIIFDEPTAVLTPGEVDDLLATLRGMAKAGKTIVLITHKLHEVMEVSDRVVVMRGGKVVAQLRTAETNAEELSFHMIGRHLEHQQLAPAETGAPLLAVKDLSKMGEDGRPLLRRVDLQVHSGEIVGIAGVSGNGQSELVRCITGLDSEYTGAVELNGTDISRRGVGAFRGAGGAHIPEDRYEWGSALEATLTENALMGQENNALFSKGGILSWKAAKTRAAAYIEKYKVKADSPDQKMKALSGGNAQKLIAAREIEGGAPLLIASEPTRGIDIGAMEFIYDLLLQKRQQGGGVLLVSSELSEILLLCDRIYVIYEGALRQQFRHSAVDERELGLVMLGGGGVAKEN